MNNNEQITNEVKYLNDFTKMYFASPIVWEERRIDTLGDLFDLYTKKKGHDSDFRTTLDFANWLTCKMKADHSFGLLFPTKEMIVLDFVVEQCYCLRNSWYRDSSGNLHGDWTEKINNNKTK
ncbi:MAG: hypothetical protein PHN69_03560 [Candidatus Pacebacteria bacterium]|nr:hypothetical protein [Fermentimonas sp.]MDD4804227.1 hypothetical protein [Candidatus Paceibacterota bacterium]